MGFDETLGVDVQRWIDGVLDGIIVMPASSVCSSSGNVVNNSIVSCRKPDLASDALRFAVLGEGGGSCKVVQAGGALQLFIAMSRRLEMLNEGGFTGRALTGKI